MSEDLSARFPPCNLGSSDSSLEGSIEGIENWDGWGLLIELPFQSNPMICRSHALVCESFAIFLIIVTSLFSSDVTKRFGTEPPTMPTWQRP